MRVLDSQFEACNMLNHFTRCQTYDFRTATNIVNNYTCITNLNLSPINNIR